MGRTLQEISDWVDGLVVRFKAEGRWEEAEAYFREVEGRLRAIRHRLSPVVLKETIWTAVEANFPVGSLPAASLPGASGFGFDDLPPLLGAEALPGAGGQNERNERNEREVIADAGVVPSGHLAVPDEEVRDISVVSAAVGMAAAARASVTTGQAKASSDIVKPWGELPAKQGDLKADVQWVYDNFALVVDDRLGTATVLRWGKAQTPPPSRSAEGMMKFAASNPTKFLGDVVHKVLGKLESETEVIRYEKKREADMMRVFEALAKEGRRVRRALGEEEEGEEGPGSLAASDSTPLAGTLPGAS